MKLKYFTIFGERNSGTKYLKRVVLDNFDLEFTKDFGFKHWYIKGLEPRGVANSTTDNECLRPLTDPMARETLFLFIVRNPFDWVESMYRKPYHILFPNPSYISLTQFMCQPYLAGERNLPQNHDPQSITPWKKDGSIYYIEDCKDILELRNLKNDHFFNLRRHVEYFELVQQDNLKTDLERIARKYNLGRKEAFLNEYRNPRSERLLSNTDREWIRGKLNNVIDNMLYFQRAVNNNGSHVYRMPQDVNPTVVVDSSATGGLAVSGETGACIPG